jgi:hypothetical protein
MNGAYTRRIKVVGEKDQKRKSVFYVVLSAIILLVIVWLVIDALSGKNKTDDVSAEATEKTETQIIEVEKVVEVEKTITTEMLQESLNEMGVLVTEEYYFTQVENYEKTKPVFKIFTSKSNCIYSYDGVVAAGIDFNSISLEKDEENKVISILVPASTIQYVDIDYESFQVYEEKEGIWNPLSMDDYNESLENFKESASEKAQEKGVLEKADEHAREIIQNFILGMIDDPDYTIVWE